jgi:hypothetical protein
MMDEARAVAGGVSFHLPLLSSSQQLHPMYWSSEFHDEQRESWIASPSASWKWRSISRGEKHCHGAICILVSARTLSAITVR